VLEPPQHGAHGRVFEAVARQQRFPAGLGRAFGVFPVEIHHRLLDLAQRGAAGCGLFHFAAPSAFQPPARLASTITRTAGERRLAAWLAASVKSTLARLV